MSAGKRDLFAWRQYEEIDCWYWDAAHNLKSQSERVEDPSDMPSDSIRVTSCSNCSIDTVAS